MPKDLTVKRQEAFERQQAHESRTPEDQMALIEGRPGASKRERDKLMARIDRRGKVTR